MPPSRASSLHPQIPPPPDLFSTLPLVLSPPSSASPKPASRKSSSLPLLESSYRPHQTIDGRYFTTWRDRTIRLTGPSSWPCDSIEKERQEAEHYLLRLLLGYPYLGPVESVLRKAGTRARVLDVGTGTGVWAGDIGEMFPWAEIVGCDDIPLMDLYVFLYLGNVLRQIYMEQCGVSHAV